MAEESPARAPDPQLVAAVDALRARYEWRLLSRDEFIARLGAHLASAEFRSLSAAAFNLYTLTLYVACSGMEGPDRQERAYHELARFLYDLAWRRYGHDGAAEVDDALGDIFEHFAACRKPGAFLAFAHQRLRNLIRRQRSSRTVSIDDHEDQLVTPADEGLEHVLAAELQERVATCRAMFLQKHKRARLQFEAVWMKHLLRLDDCAIAARLGKAPKQIYVLRARGISKLRQEPAWRALAADLGLPLS
jgi:hypothetical protein